MAHFLVTGGAGFIGSHLCARLLAAGDQVTCLDNLDDFYTPAIKRAHVHRLQAGAAERFTFQQGDIRDQGTVRRCFERAPIDCVIHLAARAGVRPSIAQPLLYSQVNIQGTVNLLECCRQYRVQQFVFGSSSSVYGARQRGPFAETDDVSTPVSPYAATKRAGELLCYTYAHLFTLHVTCLRFFTVYGPAQRPDLAIHKFARLLMQDKPLPVYGDGTSQRDYTYIDDIVDGIMRACAWLQRQPPSTGCCEIFNLGDSHPVSLLELIRLLEEALGRKATIDWQPAQPGDVPITFADLHKSQTMLGYRPQVDIVTGIQRFATWFLQEWTTMSPEPS